MIKLYKYFYYRIYTWNKKKWGEKDLPQLNAMLGVSFMIFVNICLIGILFELVGLNIFFKDALPKLELIIIIICLFVINYFVFLHQKKYLIIEKQFKKETSKRKRLNSILIFIYVVISFLLPIIGVIILRNLHGR